MIYQLWIEKAAERDIEALDARERRRVAEAVRRLTVDHLGHATKPLGGDLSGLRSARVGSMRICYQVDTAARQVTIVAVGHRRDVYRRTRRWDNR